MEDGRVESSFLIKKYFVIRNTYGKLAWLRHGRKHLICAQKSKQIDQIWGRRVWLLIIQFLLTFSNWKARISGPINVRGHSFPLHTQHSIWLRTFLLISPLIVCCRKINCYIDIIIVKQICFRVSWPFSDCNSKQISHILWNVQNFLS